MLRFNGEVAAALGISPEYIRQVRKKLNLGQKEAGKLLGGGANAFSRYETGKTPPPVPLVKLLRILDSHPELLPMVR
jgi:HTH-type transcriptional regulator/antitoxin MqsA